MSANERQRELLMATMVELGCRGFQETDETLLCYFEKPLWNDLKFDSLKRELRSILNIVSVNAAVTFREFEDQNWNEEWERSIQPIEIGSRIVIRPSWAEYKGSSDRIIIVIDPKMSFGTGYHETTRLTLALLEKYLTPRGSVLDVGTGTGILAIAAIRLGASNAEGIDNDDWCIENATENVNTNGVDGEIRISKKTMDEFPDAAFDLITANLTLNTNLDFLPGFRRVLRDGGTMLLSGLLGTDEPAMRDGLLAQGLFAIETVQENEWIALAVKRRV